MPPLFEIPKNAELLILNSGDSSKEDWTLTDDTHWISLVILVEACIQCYSTTPPDLLHKMADVVLVHARHLQFRRIRPVDEVLDICVHHFPDRSLLYS